MATLWTAYPSEFLARRAVAALRAADVPGRDILLLTGRPLHDVRREPTGAFAGTATPDAPVGTFANTRRLRRQGAGSFAGDPDRQRQGSFADSDADVVVRFERGATRERVTGDLAIRRLLRSAALDDTAAERVIGQLHAGRAVVLVEIAAIGASDARETLESVTPAA